METTHKECEWTPEEMDSARVFIQQRRETQERAAAEYYANREMEERQRKLQWELDNARTVAAAQQAAAAQLTKEIEAQAPTTPMVLLESTSKPRLYGVHDGPIKSDFFGYQTIGKSKCKPSLTDYDNGEEQSGYVYEREEWQ